MHLEMLQTLREISILKRCHHRNIVRLIEIACEVENQDEAVEENQGNDGADRDDATGCYTRMPKILLVFEYAEHDLVGIIDVIKSNQIPRFKRFSHREMGCYAKQIIRAVA